MSRIPKYRAWYKPLGVMIEPENLVMINFDTKVLGVYLEMDGKGYHELRMSDFELMQYTGRCDLHGREIFEGDITKQTYHAEGRDENHELVSFDGWHIGPVMLTPGAGIVMKHPIRYSLETDETEPTKMYKKVSGKRAEVIDNIYENPALLGGEAAKA
ncbi:YopX family protein [Paenibacillus graminis]|uniref:YopX protein domain-containing protein n=1 Tax=Paenibacillus graminis TaxID=189425 RepID=A0A089MAV7_9BACL|nr:YopX family protein [Paenibacillus graminis]AIQ69490.1 hypothetical protein PGRAT_18960 [Paenibacillus graminis]